MPNKTDEGHRSSDFAVRMRELVYSPTSRPAVDSTVLRGTSSKFSDTNGYEPGLTWRPPKTTGNLLEGPDNQRMGKERDDKTLRRGSILH